MMPLLNTATAAARRAGDMALRYADRIEQLTVRSKSPNELVTEVDEAAERIIVEHIRTGYPDHAFLGEEGGATGSGDYEWIIDPLDGTTNYIHRFPVFCVSLALRRRGELQLGVIYDPMRQEMFTCTRGGGARMNERRIRASRQETLAGSLIGTGFPYRRNLQWVDVYMRMLRQVMRHTSGVRRPGAAALDLAYVAAGTPGRILGIRAQALGHRGGGPADRGSGRLDLGTGTGHRLHGDGPCAGGDAKGVCGTQKVI